jgi:hypothetical protein
MRKIFLVLGGVLIIGGLSGSVSAQTTGNQYPTKPADAAGINEIQGQVRGGYFQENSLKQDAGGVSQNPNGSASILKNSDGTQKIVVVGALPEANGTNDKNIPWVGLIIFLAVMLAPLVLIVNMLKKTNEQKRAMATTASVSASQPETKQVSESKTEAEPATEAPENTTEPKPELKETVEENPVDDVAEETAAPETEKPVLTKVEKKSIPKKPKKHKKKSKKGKKKKK